MALAEAYAFAPTLEKSLSSRCETLPGFPMARQRDSGVRRSCDPMLGCIEPTVNTYLSCRLPHAWHFCLSDY